MIPAQRRRRRMSVALAVGDGLGGVVSSDRKGTHAVLGAYRATPRGRRSLVARAGLIVAITLICGLGGVSTSVAAAAAPTYAWATQGGGTGGAFASGVSALANGSSIITGSFKGIATFGTASLISTGGSYDAFTAKVNANGTYAWTTRGGGTGYDYAYGVSALADGSSIITGRFRGTATFGTAPPPSQAPVGQSTRLRRRSTLMAPTPGPPRLVGGALTTHMTFRHLRMVRASSPDVSGVLRPSEPRGSEALGQSACLRRRSTLMAPTPGPFGLGVRVIPAQVMFRLLRMVRASSPDPSWVLRPSEPRP